MARVSTLIQCRRWREMWVLVRVRERAQWCTKVCRECSKRSPRPSASPSSRSSSSPLYPTPTPGSMAMGGVCLCRPPQQRVCRCSCAIRVSQVSPPRAPSNPPLLSLPFLRFLILSPLGLYQVGARPGRDSDSRVLTQLAGVVHRVLLALVSLGIGRIRMRIASGRGRGIRTQVPVRGPSRMRARHCRGLRILRMGARCSLLVAVVFNNQGVRISPALRRRSRERMRR